MSVAAVDDPLDWRRVAGARGLLGVFNEAGLLDAADVHVALRLAQLAGEADESVALAVAFLVRALRGGSVCVDLPTMRADFEVDDVGWPEPDEWLAAVRASPLLDVAVRFYRDLLYLDRYWREEDQVCGDLLARLASGAPPQVKGLDAALDRVFPAPGYHEQRAAARITLSQWTTVLTGGPGTGKTTTVAGLLALFAEQTELAGKPPSRVALAAPTGKAAARLQEAVRKEIAKLAAADRARLADVEALTLHRLLGRRPDSSVRFRHHRGNRLPHDVVVVDETSMVSLTMMARLLEALRPQARLILVGDPDQLTSVQAGAVLADLVEGLGGRDDVRIAQLRTAHRFGETIGALAAAIRGGDADQVVELLRAGGEHIEWLGGEDISGRLRGVLIPHALATRAAALSGDARGALAAVDAHRLLCAHRHGPHGVSHWNRQVEVWLTEETGDPHWSRWYAGRPVLVTANDYGLGLFNGDTGVAVVRDGVLRAVMAAVRGTVELATGRLADVETMHAMTIHKSQGSQADEVSVLLPPAESRILTRELFYTAVTRARSRVRVVGSEADVRAAVGRRALRATGLRLRLAAAKH
ncbi:MAG: exodeoxyribonuclease V subunit alpha [Mycobacteriaceae bacterium]|nr:exodeoxyribonuclease V subunit alpha [Mycobacteriaceae bacterium]MBV9641524.1 exodeoxyribonuclease V subunit alpha [Mycobacteriaceae bacterium]